MMMCCVVSRVFHKGVAIKEYFVASFAILSAYSFPFIPLCAGIHTIVIFYLLLFIVFFILFMY